MLKKSEREKEKEERERLPQWLRITFSTPNQVTIPLRFFNGTCYND